MEENPSSPTPETETLRYETARIEAVVQAHRSVMDMVLGQFRMVSVRPPFQHGDFNHMLVAGGSLTLCRRIAVLTARGVAVDLAQVDCLRCLEAFTEATRP